MTCSFVRAALGCSAILMSLWEEFTIMTSTPGVHQSLDAGLVVRPGLNGHPNEELLGDGVHDSAGERKDLKEVCQCKA